MRFRYFILLAILLVLIGLNITGQGITSVVGEGPWQPASMKYSDERIIFGLFEREITLKTPKIFWRTGRALREIRDLYSK